MNGTKVLALAAVGAFLIVAAPLGSSAQAASLINPGAASAVQQGAKQDLTTEVRWGHHRHWHHRWHHHRWHHRWHRHHWHHRWHRHYR